MSYNALGPNPLSFFGGAGGISTPYGVLLPPGSKVAAYLRSTGVQGDQLDPPDIQNRLVTQLSQALRYCRSGKGDTIVVLPGHTENVVDATMLDNLVPGTRIVGIGSGSQMPTFIWTATGSQWVVNDAGFEISGCHLNLAGANGVVKAVLITAVESRINRCRISLATGAALKATIGIEYGAGSGSGELVNNDIRGTATHNVTDGIKIVSAVPNLRITDNLMMASATAANGLIHATAAATELYIARNSIYNTHTASSSAIVVDAVAATGIIEDNRLGTLGSTASQPLLIGAGADLRLFDNKATDTGGASSVSQSGIVNPPGVTL